MSQRKTAAAAAAHILSVSDTTLTLIFKLELLGSGQVEHTPTDVVTLHSFDTRGAATSHPTPVCLCLVTTGHSLDGIPSLEINYGTREATERVKMWVEKSPLGMLRSTARAQR